MSTDQRVRDALQARWMPPLSLWESVDTHAPGVSAEEFYASLARLLATGVAVWREVSATPSAPRRRQYRLAGGARDGRSTADHPRLDGIAARLLTISAATLLDTGSLEPVLGLEVEGAWAGARVGRRLQQLGGSGSIVDAYIKLLEPLVPEACVRAQEIVDTVISRDRVVAVEAHVGPPALRIRTRLEVRRPAWGDRVTHGYAVDDGGPERYGRAEHRLFEQLRTAAATFGVR